MNNRRILVTGATGQQGGATARHLVEKGWQVRALTRHPDQSAARVLGAQGIEIVTGDLEDRDSLKKALEGIYGVFSVQQFYGIGAEGEIRQGKNIADAAKAANIQHFVYASVGSADQNTGIPHFESKYAIEQYIQSINLPFTILRPVFFMENFMGYVQPQLMDNILTLQLALQPNQMMQMIAIDDIGALAAEVFENPSSFLGKALPLAGDELTMLQIVDVLERVTEQSHRFVEMPLEALRAVNAEVATMFEWFQRHGYDADIPVVQSIHPALMSFETWVKTVFLPHNNTTIDN